MNRDVALEWARRLPSYKKGKEYLCQYIDGVPHYCAFGVLCEIAVEQGVIPPAEVEKQDPTDRTCTPTRHYYMGWDELAPDKVREWAELKSRQGEALNSHSIVELNDKWGVNFVQMAEYIKNNWERL